MTAELIIDFEDATTADELREAITNVCFRAKREMAVIGTTTHPTPYDRRHREIDRLLHELERVAR